MPKLESTIAYLPTLCKYVTAGLGISENRL
jgi:hypothetical protein